MNLLAQQKFQLKQILCEQFNTKSARIFQNDILLQLLSQVEEYEIKTKLKYDINNTLRSNKNTLKFYQLAIRNNYQEYSYDPP